MEDGAMTRYGRFFAIDRFEYWIVSFVRWVGWEMSIGVIALGDSAASSFVLDSGLLVKLWLKYNYYTCSNVMSSAKALSTVHFLRLECCATSGIFHG